METEPKLSEVLAAVKTQQAEADRRFDELLGAVKSGFDSMDEKLIGLDQRATKIEANMVTKNYLDEKLGNVDGKVNALVHVLQEKRVITEDDKRNIHA